MKTKLKLLFIVFFICIIADSCKKNAAPPKVDTPKESDLQVIAKLGFNTSGIIEKSDGYIVENDIFLSKDSLRQSYKNASVIVAKTEQYNTTNLVTGLPRTITMYSPLSGVYLSALDDAITRWNSLGLLITFQRVSSPPYDITVTSAYQNSNILAVSGFPFSDGRPYNYITLNTYNLTGTTNQDYISSTIQHEMGHTIGMRHTDYADRSYSCGGTASPESSIPDGAIYIPGTPSGPDPQSIMLACNSGLNRTFTSNDIIAVSYLYTSSHIPGPQPVYLFYNSGLEDHFTAANRNATLSSSGWAYYGVIFKAYLTNASGTVPVYEFYNTSTGDHYDSINPNEVNGLANWVNDGIKYYAYSTNVSGSIPVYSFYNSSKTDHYLTPDINAVNGSSGWVNEGVKFYVLPK
ncbi:MULTISPECIES: M57 family metalloprotease [Mucilaginibacter]|uniref:M57 family metalloprotease n=1 Tax=Mucilaginibacter TaxID=423349 RepID=UPI00166A0A8D|nr:M57 family metalloprotease [Mucilaginibacter rubeus]GGB04605.1 hypothetical protein GCM10011500_20300 [Mucilaginibacter rubeus]